MDSTPVPPLLIVFGLILVAATVETMLKRGFPLKVVSHNDLILS